MVSQLRQALDNPNFPEITYRRGASGLPMPAVRGTRIRVQTLAIAAYDWKMNAADIAEDYGLDERAVQSALDFYATHRAEIEPISLPNERYEMSASAPKLHLDADASSKALQQALLNRGLDVTRTPNEWMRADAGDEQQLLGATAQGRVIFIYNIRDFQDPAKRY